MSPDPDFSAAASLLTEPTRAAILARLLDGRAWTAGELAKAASVGPSTCSAHLSKLLDGGWVRMFPHGRHRYFTLGSADLAGFLETLARFAPASAARTPGERHASAALRHCRLCYDHLAGRVGVAITEGLVARGWLSSNPGAFQLTSAGHHEFLAQGFDLGMGPAKACMDWSERRPHWAGAPGRAFAAACLERGWFQRDPTSRALWITPSGREAFSVWLDLVFPPAS